MTRVIISGCNGKMGKVVAECISARNDCEVAAGIDITGGSADFPLFSSPNDDLPEADVLIDFSHPSLLSPLLQLGKKRRMPLVLCTTGYSPNQVQDLTDSAKEIPIFYSRNMSLGINLLIELAKKAEQVLGGSFDVEIIEKHHNQKIDAPSGTALMLADEIADAGANKPYHYMYDRHSQRKKREPDEIGIHSIRGGTIVGEHDVIFAGRHEVITLSHSAQSKEVFASGAVNAAVFLAAQPAGLYDMSDLLKD